MKFLIAIIFALLTSLFFLSMPAASVVAGSLPAKSDESMQFTGVFTSTTVQDVSGLITITLTINPDDTIEGNVDLSQYTNGQFTCGSGDFAGTKSDETIELTFVSDDASPACGFYKGVTFTIEAALLNNSIIRGDYSTDAGYEGVVELTRVLPKNGIFLPMIRP